MPDLADRISRAAVAALDLAPFDDRYGRLSRQVLAGGASRFQRVTADDQAVHFVIPVGLAGQRIDYGALVLQDRQAGILWRDAMGIDHSIVVPRADGAATFSPLTLGGEQWTRFDVDGDGQHLAFLVPPVSDPLLRSTLIDWFGARPGDRHTASAPVPEPEPEPGPAVRFPDPAPEPEPQPVETTAVLPMQDPVEETAVLDTPVEGDAPDSGAVFEAPAEPTLEPTPIPEGDPLAPQDQFAVSPADLNEWAPEPAHDPDATHLHVMEDTRLHDVEATRVRPVPPTPQQQRVDAPFDLYRDEETTPTWAAAETQAVPIPAPSPAPAPLPAQGPAESSPWTHQQPAPEGRDRMSATVRPAEAAAPVYVQQSGTSRTLVGFLLGLLGTLAVGGAIIIATLLGAG